MVENFDKAWAFTQRWEGGEKISRDPNDPGGTTKWGISGHHHPGIDIEKLTEDKAKAIAKPEYWNAAGCDRRPWPLDLLAFDTAFNLGLDDVQAIDPKASTWEAWLLRRVMKHIRVARKLPFEVRKNRWGWLFRCYDLYKICSGGE
jgi:hypothetical protein